ncbi:gas vesicle structural protein GvpA [Streptomyces sp. Da 82-17]|uniref:gas vesicle structural protein GvpA n=1 Tax=Streptomyces sp. Da 82-17 TaxID=3377116 RepID=UPI0038D42F15
MTVVPQNGGPVSRDIGGGSSSLYDVVDLILDRGLVIDVFVRVSLVGIELVKVDARVVVASVDTYLRFAEECNRLDLESGKKKPEELTDLVGEVTEGGAEHKTKGALSGAAEAVSNALTGGKSDEESEGGDAEAEQDEGQDEGEDEAEAEEEAEKEPVEKGEKPAAKRERPARRSSRHGRE